MSAPEKRPPHPFGGLWMDPDDDPRSSDLHLGDERAVLTDYLAHYRQTLELKCADLSPAQLATRAVPPSALSLLGLVRHMARVEHHWTRRVMQGSAEPRIYPDDAGFGEVSDSAEAVEEAFDRWRAEIAHATAYAAKMPLEQADPKAEINLREVLVHLIEEYARHCGHADLLREVIDGRTGV